MAGRRRRRATHEEEHESHERWMVTYADMITLLMVLFIVLFAMSSVDAQKFEQLRASLSGAFGGSQHLVAGGASTSVDTEGVGPDPVDVAAGAAGDTSEASARQAAQDQAAVQRADRAKASANQRAAEAEVDRLLRLRDRMRAELDEEGLADQVRFSVDGRGLVVTVLTSGVVFAGDRAELRPEGRRILRALVPALRSIPNGLEISGHTNQLPVPTRAYPSSWELSTARASSVVRYLLGFDGMAARRMTAAGYADQRPLYPPADPRAVTMNRRVDVVVLSDQPADVRALLAVQATGK
jgi:chemotaxis protein MotB